MPLLKAKTMTREKAAIKKIKRLMKQRGLRPADFERSTRINITDVYEDGMLNLDSLEVICNALGLNMGKFVKEI